MSEDNLKKDLLKLAHAKPELRRDILNIIKKASEVEDLNVVQKNLTKSKSDIDKALKALKKEQDNISDILGDLDKHSESIPGLKIKLKFFRERNALEGLSFLRNYLNKLALNLDEGIRGLEKEKELDRTLSNQKK